MPLLSSITANFRRFLSDEDGAAAIEFLMTLPLLIGVLLFTAEYGTALRAKMVLNTAAADAARLLARAPIYDDGSSLKIYDTFRNDAGNMVSGMIGGPVEISTLIYTPNIQPQGYFRTDKVLIRLTADAYLTMPLLGFINDTLEWASQFAIGAPSEAVKIATAVPLRAVQTVPWLGGSAINAAECTIDANGLVVLPCEPAASP